MAKKDDKQAANQTKEQPVDLDGWLTRAEVAARLHCSTQKVRHWEGRRLHGKQDSAGTWLFDPIEIDAIAEMQDEQPAGAAILQIQADLIGQLQIHLQETMDRANAGQKAVLDMLEKTVANLATRNDTLTNERLATIGTVESLLSEKSLRDLEERKAEQSAELRKEAAQKFFALLPILARKLTGDKSSGASPDLVKALRESLTPEQGAAIAGILRPEQMAVLGELVATPEPEPDPEPFI